MEAINRQESETKARLDKLREEYDERHPKLRQELEDAGRAKDGRSDAGWLCDRLPCNWGDTVRPHLQKNPAEPNDLSRRRSNDGRLP
jgi:hypothetical protein